MKNHHAVSLGKLAKGKKKTLTDEQRLERKKMMAHARKSRWPKKKTLADRFEKAGFTNIKILEAKP